MRLNTFTIIFKTVIIFTLILFPSLSFSYDLADLDAAIISNGLTQLYSPPENNNRAKWAYNPLSFTDGTVANYRIVYDRWWNPSYLVSTLHVTQYDNLYHGHLHTLETLAYGAISKEDIQAMPDTSCIKKLMGFTQSANPWCFTDATSGTETVTEFTSVISIVSSSVETPGDGRSLRYDVGLTPQSHTFTGSYTNGTSSSLSLSYCNKSGLVNTDTIFYECLSETLERFALYETLGPTADIGYEYSGDHYEIRTPYLKGYYWVGNYNGFYSNKLSFIVTTKNVYDRLNQWPYPKLGQELLAWWTPERIQPWLPAINTDHVLSDAAIPWGDYAVSDSIRDQIKSNLFSTIDSFKTSASDMLFHNNVVLDGGSSLYTYTVYGTPHQVDLAVWSPILSKFSVVMYGVTLSVYMRYVFFRKKRGNY